ncbi:hypothetical protein P7L74_25615 [Tistrella mobilis]
MNEMDKVIADDAEARIEWEVPTLAKLSAKAAEGGLGIPSPDGSGYS